MALSVSAAIPQGRIEVVAADDPADIRLRVPPDPGTGFLHWYHFRVAGARGVPCRFTIVNAGDSRATRLANREGYDDQWTGTGPLVSHDGGATWVRVPATCDGEAYSFAFTPESDAVLVGKFAPFGPERDQALTAKALAAGARLEVIGTSVQGRPIDLWRFGTPGPGKPRLWIVGRQHPAETQGGFLLEGLVERLGDPADALARVLTARASLAIVPNANPDGLALGLGRANAAGRNLNREWAEPHPDAPEVAAIRRVMEAEGVDFFLDAHADHELKCVFTWPSENVPSWTPARRAPFAAFEAAWAAATPDYVPGQPYPGGCPEAPDLTMAWNWVGERFPQSLSILLEQPFKEAAGPPVPETGWSPARAAALGRALPAALVAVLPHLSAP